MEGNKVSPVETFSAYFQHLTNSIEKRLYSEADSR